MLWAPTNGSISSAASLLAEEIPLRANISVLRRWATKVLSNRSALPVSLKGIPMPTRANIETFVAAWLARNVRQVPRTQWSSEVDRLAAGLTGEARSLGISGGDLNRALGNIDYYLDAQLHARTIVPD